MLECTTINSNTIDLYITVYYIHASTNVFYRHGEQNRVIF